MGFTRRTFLKGSAAAGSAAAATHFLYGPLETVVAGAADPEAKAGEELVPTTCWIGKQECGMIAHKVDGRVVKFEGHPANPRNLGTLCPKGVAQIMALYDPNRVKTPLIRENDKGGPGKWRQASWDEALTAVAAKVKEARDKDPGLVLWQKGRSKSEPMYDNAFVGALKSEKLGHGAYCSDAGYRACEYTVGIKGVLHPDFRYTEYVLSWGWNLTNAGGNKYCWLTWPRLFLEARERGAKVVAIDPRARGVGPHADEWLPIRPSTDLALALAISNVLIAKGFIDKDYLVKYTNAPVLVKGDGSVLKVRDQEAAWDPATSTARPVDEVGSAAALEGEYSAGGESVKTAYQLFKESVAKNTPEWASGVCGVPASKIERLATEIGQNARIGSTIMIDGVKVPHRPVGVMFYHAAQQEHGFQATRAIVQAMMLIGAVGAAGGTFMDTSWKVDKNFKELNEIEIKDAPKNYVLKNSKYYPINSGNPGVGVRVMADPAKYGVKKVPEVMLIHMANPVRSFASQPDFLDGYKRFKYIAVLSPWLSETADYFADVILPTATIEKYEGPMKVGDPYNDALSLRIPPIEPLFESRGEVEIYLDLAEKIGVLFGKEGYLDLLNKELEMKEQYALPLDKKPAVRDIFDRWAKSAGVEEGVAYFEKKGVKSKGPIAPSKIYGYATDPAFGGIRHRLYGESLLKYQKKMQEMGADKSYWQDYTPLPVWREPTMNGSPPQFDLWLISYKTVEHKQSRTNFVPLLAEQAPHQRLDINPETARSRGIKDGEEVWVESQNAVTGETRKLKTVAAYCEAIRPDTVGMLHHFGGWTHPWSKDQGPTPNAIFFTGEGYVGMTADQAFQAKVRVTKA